MSLLAHEVRHTDRERKTIDCHATRNTFKYKFPSSYTRSPSRCSNRVFTTFTVISLLNRRSLCLFQGAGQDRLGIYIKSVVAGGAADAVSHYEHFFNELNFIKWRKKITQIIDFVVIFELLIFTFFIFLLQEFSRKISLLFLAETFPIEVLLIFLSIMLPPSSKCSCQPRNINRFCFL